MITNAFGPACNRNSMPLARSTGADFGEVAFGFSAFFLAPMCVFWPCSGQLEVAMYDLKQLSKAPPIRRVDQQQQRKKQPVQTAQIDFHNDAHHRFSHFCYR